MSETSERRNFIRHSFTLFRKHAVRRCKAFASLLMLREKYFHGYKKKNIKKYKLVYKKRLNMRRKNNPGIRIGIEMVNRIMLLRRKHSTFVWNFVLSFLSTTSKQFSLLSMNRFYVEVIRAAQELCHSTPPSLAFPSLPFNGPHEDMEN